MSGAYLYVIVRSDLKWTPGILATQVGHAVSLLIHEHYTVELKAYLDQLYDMKKVVLRATALEFDAIKDALSKHGISHSVWLERPENVESAIAVSPLSKHQVPSIISQLKLY